MRGRQFKLELRDVYFLNVVYALHPLIQFAMNCSLYIYIYRPICVVVWVCKLFVD